MTNNTGALTRLTEITDKIKNYAFDDKLEKHKRQDGHYVLGAAVSYCLGRDIGEDGIYEYNDIIIDYAEMYNICIKALEFTKKYSSPRAVADNLMTINGVVRLYTAHGAFSYTDEVYSFSTETISKLKLIANNLSDRETEIIVSQSQITDITHQISLLIALIATSDIDDDVKNALIRTLTSLNDAVHRVNYIGPEKMLDQLDKMLGQIFQGAAVAPTNEKRQPFLEWLKRATGIAEAGQKLFEATKPAHPLILSGYTHIVKHWILGGNEDS